MSLIILDGQTIASRLAQKISATTNTLKRSVNRFNGLRHDVLEGTAYCLPNTLNWETLSNLEQVTSLEIASLAGTCSIPIEAYVKILRAANMKNRCTEEQQMINNEIRNTEGFLKKDHANLQEQIQLIKQSGSELSQFNSGCVNLLFQRLLLCEASLINFAQTIGLYHCVQLPDLILLGSDGKFSTSIEADSDDSQSIESIIDVDDNESSDSEQSITDEC